METINHVNDTNVMNIKPQDLRIGNLLECNGLIQKISSIDSIIFEGHHIMATLKYKDSPPVPITWFKPIPLNEDWLIKAGFEKKIYYTEGIVIEIKYFKLKNIIVYILKNSFEVEIVIKNEQFNLFKNWHYVHDLQNVFYMFTGEELTITQ